MLATISDEMSVKQLTRPSNQIAGAIRGRAALSTRDGLPGPLRVVPSNGYTGELPGSKRPASAGTTGSDPTTRICVRPRTRR